MTAGGIDFSLDFTYEGRKEPSLKEAEGTIGQGRCIVLCGGSGCGKSTLIRCFSQLIPQFYEGELTGGCTMDGRDMKDMSIGETGRYASSVFQDPRSQFFTINSDTEAAFGLENHGMKRDDIRERVDEAFRTFSMEKLRDRNVFSMSSGERQITAVISSWAMDTGIMLLDEPAANLDSRAVETLRKALVKMKEEGKTMVVSEHRLYYLRDIADEYWLMKDGRIEHRYTADEMKAMGTEELRRSSLRTLDLGDLEMSLQERPPAEAHHSLEAKEVSFSYGRGRRILKDISFRASTGDVIALAGMNGCGKTTLGKTCAGLLKPSSGKILIDGREAGGRKLSDEAMFVMQEAEFQFFTNSVEGELTYGVKDAGEAGTEELLEMTGLLDCRRRHPFTLSGGQMQKLAVLPALMSSKPVIILDEPTAGLDAASLEVCAGLIRRMQRDRIVILISHDLELLSMTATHALLMEDGRAEDVLDMRQESSFRRLRDHLEGKKEEVNAWEKRGEGRKLDPRSRFIMAAAAMTAGIGTDMSIILAVFAVTAAAGIYERRYTFAAGFTAIMAVCCGCWYIHPSVATSFIASFFPRMIVIGAGAVLALSPADGSRILAGLRALHIPEKVNMMISVAFRFFPVLRGDMKLMFQSIRTRGFFSTFREKITAVPEYLEIMIVPMVFRVLRIAESLSASAETRGIALPGRRDSYASIGWHAADTVMMILMAAAVILQFFI